MSNIEQAAEPTMEEILSSIRKIISDDDQDDAPALAAPPVEAVAAPEPVIEPDDDPGDDIFELTEVVTEEAPVEDDFPDNEVEAPSDGLIDPETVDDLEFVAVEPEPEPEPELEPEPQPMVEYSAVEESVLEVGSRALLSDEAGIETSAAFNQLAETLLSRNGTSRTIEELVQDMLRPMMKGWLDANLPPLVERLVREEIERVARRR